MTITFTNSTQPVFIWSRLTQPLLDRQEPSPNLQCTCASYWVIPRKILRSDAQTYPRLKLSPRISQFLLSMFGVKFQSPDLSGRLYAYFFHVDFESEVENDKIFQPTSKHMTKHMFEKTKKKKKKSKNKKRTRPNCERRIVAMIRSKEVKGVAKPMSETGGLR